MCIMFRDKWIILFFKFPFCGDFSLHLHKMVQETSRNITQAENLQRHVFWNLSCWHQYISYIVRCNVYLEVIKKLKKLHYVLSPCPFVNSSSYKRNITSTRFASDISWTYLVPWLWILNNYFLSGLLNCDKRCTSPRFHTLNWSECWSAPK